MEKIFDRHHASAVPADELTTSPGKVWYLPRFDIYHPKNLIKCESFSIVVPSLTTSP